MNDRGEVAPWDRRTSGVRVFAAMLWLHTLPLGANETNQTIYTRDKSRRVCAVVSHQIEILAMKVYFEDLEVLLELGVGETCLQQYFSNPWNEPYDDVNWYTDAIDRDFESTTSEVTAEMRFEAAIKEAQPSKGGRWSNLPKTLQNSTRGEIMGKKLSWQSC